MNVVQIYYFMISFDLCLKAIKKKHLRYFCFFFQAEDGIRDDLVTGVQTCALPICVIAELPCSKSGEIEALPRCQRKDGARLEKNYLVYPLVSSYATSG